MIDEVFVHLFAAILLVDARKNKHCALVIGDYMRCDISVSSLEALISQVFKAKLYGIIGGSLFSIADPEVNVI
jgi:hypothetical protein